MLTKQPTKQTLCSADNGLHCSVQSGVHQVCTGYFCIIVVKRLTETREVRLIKAHCIRGCFSFLFLWGVCVCLCVNSKQFKRGPYLAHSLGSSPSYKGTHSRAAWVELVVQHPSLGQWARTVCMPVLGSPSLLTHQHLPHNPNGSSVINMITVTLQAWSERHTSQLILHFVKVTTETKQQQAQCTLVRKALQLIVVGGVWRKLLRCGKQGSRNHCENNMASRKAHT